MFSQQRSTTATSSTATVTSDNNRASPRTRIAGLNSPSHPESHRNSPKVVDNQHFADDATACSSSAGCSWDEMPNSGNGFDILETASFLNHFSPKLFGTFTCPKNLILFLLIVTVTFAESIYCSHIINKFIVPQPVCHHKVPHVPCAMIRNCTVKSH
jgi:hypothetical protein